jgi:hypothetical protein
VACKFCGWKDGSRQYIRNVGDVCYCCGFWQPYIRQRDDLRFARFKGLHYTLLGDREYGLRSFPDSLWSFEFNDGRVAVTNNVTCQGAIPPRFTLQLPNNVRKLQTTWRFKDAVAPGPGWGDPMLDEDVEPVVHRRPDHEQNHKQGSLF